MTEVHVIADTHSITDLGNGGNRIDQSTSDTHGAAVDPITYIREGWRKRQDHQRAWIALNNQIKSYCRRAAGVLIVKGKPDKGGLARAAAIYDAIMADNPGTWHARAYLTPWLVSRDVFKDIIAATEKGLAPWVARTPAAAWGEATRGVGNVMLAGLIGEAGDIGAYRNPSCLWKRFGLAVIDGERQRKVLATKLDPEKPLRMGYSPSRHAVAWNLGACIFKSQSARIDKETGEVKREAGAYRILYDERKAYELARAPEMKAGHAHNRALRYMTKRALRDLWRAWRAASMVLSPSGSMPPADDTKIEAVASRVIHSRAASIKEAERTRPLARC